MQIANIFIFMGVFFALGFIMGFVKQNPDQALVKLVTNAISYTPFQVAALGIAVILTLICGACLLTRGIYLNKDF